MGSRGVNNQSQLFCWFVKILALAFMFHVSPFFLTLKQESDWGHLVAGVVALV